MGGLAWPLIQPVEGAVQGAAQLHETRSDLHLAGLAAGSLVSLLLGSFSPAMAPPDSSVKLSRGSFRFKFGIA